MLHRWAAFVAERAVLILLAGLAVVLSAGIYGAGVFDSLSDGGFDDPDSEAARELALERDTFGNRTVDVVAIYSSDELEASDPAFRGEVEDVLSDLPPRTTASVTDYWTSEDPSMVSDDGHAVQVFISMAGDTQDEMSRNYDELRPALDAGGGLETDVAGSWAVYGDVNTTVSEDLARAEALSLPIVLILSLLIFGSVVAALMPVMVGAVAVVGALAVVRVITGVTDVSVFSINVITLLGMGLAIDYALFVISRFREELAKLPVDDPHASRKAITVTMRTAGRTVLFSGLTVAAAMSSLLVFPQNFLRSLGFGGIAAVVVAMLAALTVLPATLRLLGRRIDAGRLPWRRHRAVAVESDHGPWAALAHSVMRRPVIYLSVIVVGLLAIASPFLGVSWGSVDYRVLPDDAPAHVAATKLNTEFGAETSSANLLVRGGDRSDVAEVVRAAEAVPGVVDVRPIESTSTPDGATTLLRATWEGNSQTESSQQIVQDLRAIDVDGTSLLVGGLTADTVDLLASVGAQLPWMGLIVVGVMLVLLFLAFGSLVLPVKAVLMNALSITASFGVVTWIFADGHLENPLGFTSSGYLDATQPILMLAILFGLSMDYEVFLLSRVREQWDRTHDNTLAVATGVQKTGRIITSAALLLAVVIGAFGTSGIVFMKMIGVGMLVALLIDATIVRALLVPATMKLLGDWNWWAPAPMRRWWDRHGLREGEPGTGPAAQPVPVGASADRPAG
jgi:RND superfamily putative drug exporter